LWGLSTLSVGARFSIRGGPRERRFFFVLLQKGQFGLALLSAAELENK
jgi:hypothetical protein